MVKILLQTCFSRLHTQWDEKTCAKIIYLCVHEYAKGWTKIKNVLNDNACNSIIAHQNWIRYFIDSFVSVLRSSGGQPVSPARGNVAFAASSEGRFSIFADFALMNPVSKIIALKAANISQLFDFDA